MKNKENTSLRTTKVLVPILFLWSVCVTSLSAQTGYTAIAEGLVAKSLARMAIVVADVDNDGRMEVISDSYNQDITIEKYDPISDSYIAIWSTHMGQPSFGIEVADIDNDGINELITATRDGYVRIWEQDNPPYGASWTISWSDYIYEPFTLTAGDIDNDGDNELLVGSLSSFHIYKHQTQHVYERIWQSESLFLEVDEGIIGDIDGDGANELILSYMNDVKIFEYQDGSLLQRWSYHYDNPEPWMSIVSFWGKGSISLGDIDNDGQLELAVINSVALPDYWFNININIFEYIESADTYSMVWSTSFQRQYGGSIGLYIGDVDNDGKNELVAGGILFEHTLTGLSIELGDYEMISQFPTLIADPDNDGLNEWIKMSKIYRLERLNTTNPFIASITPNYGPINSQVVILGANFWGYGYVTFSGLEAEISLWSDSSISVTVPSGAIQGLNSVIVHTSEGLQSNSKLFNVGDSAITSPVIESVIPSSGSVGSEVQISGFNFGQSPGTVVFGLEEALTTTWTDTLIIVTVPYISDSCDILVHTSQGSVSNTAHFTFTDPTQWIIQRIDVDGIQGTYTSLAYDQSGKPGIAYNGSPNALKYAYFDGVSWVIEQIGFLFNGSYDTDLAFDQQGRPAVTSIHTPFDTSQIKYYYFDGNAWVEDPFDGTVGGYCSIAFDSQGNPYVAYPYYSNPGSSIIKTGLRVAQREGSTWIFENVDDPLVSGAMSPGFYNSIAIDSNGRIGISYFDSTLYNHWAGNNLKYAYFDGKSWSITTIDSDNDVGLWTSLAFDSEDRPCISYFDSTNGDLKLARYNGAAWDIQLVDTNGTVGEYSSLVLDNQGRPYIGYYDKTNGDLKLAHTDGSTWILETIDTEGDVGSFCHLAKSPQGELGISYYDASNADLKFATKAAPIIVPAISSISPISGQPGTTVTIQGDNFGSNPGQVRFNENTATIVSWSINQIVCLVPPTGQIGDIPVYVHRSDGINSNLVTFNIPAIIYAPEISSLFPSTGAPGTEVFVNGQHFGDIVGSVFFNGIEGAPTVWTDSLVIVVVPWGSKTGPVDLVTQDGRRSNAMPFTVDYRGELISSLNNMRDRLVAALKEGTLRTAESYAYASFLIVETKWWQELSRALLKASSTILSTVSTFLSLDTFFTAAFNGIMVTNPDTCIYLIKTMTADPIAIEMLTNNIVGLYKDFRAYDFYNRSLGIFGHEVDKAYKKQGVVGARTYAYETLFYGLKGTPVLIPERSGEWLPAGRPRDIQWVSGTNYVVRDINNKFDQLIANIPQYLPEDFPVIEIIDNLISLANSLRVSLILNRPLTDISFLCSPDLSETETRKVSLGMLSQGRSALDSLWDAYEQNLAIKQVQTWISTADSFVSATTFYTGAQYAVRTISKSLYTLARFPLFAMPELNDLISEKDVSPRDAITGLNQIMIDALMQESTNLWAISDGVISHISYCLGNIY